MRNQASNLLAGAALLLAPGASPAQSAGGTAPPASTRADTPIDPLAIKCPAGAREGCRPASRVSRDWQLPSFDVAPEPAPTETLAQALQSAYQTAPDLEAQRYQLRASDEDYAQALSETRFTSEIQVTGTYDATRHGRSILPTPSPTVTSNTLASQAIVNQPLYSGGRAAADREAALAEVRAGRAQLRGAEGDTLLRTITSYVDVRRDTEELRLLTANLGQLRATLDEVKARREAGELTRTDIAQAETQVELAEVQTNSTRQQLEQDRAAYAAFVGHDPGVLAPPPPLPDIPESIDEAFELADEASPDLAQAIETERESRAKIASAEAQGRPTLALVGTATLTGQALPFDLHKDDREFTGEAVLTIPLTNGGRVGSVVAQAQDRNSADRLGIETARRQMVDAIVDAWNGIVTAQRNIEVQDREVASAGVFDEGSFEEYRAGLRSTFDVLYAHSTLVNAKVSLVGAQHDLYVAEATLLRRVGLLEARALLTGTGLYDPDPDLRHAARRGATPFDGSLRTLDALGKPRATQPGLEQPRLGADNPAMSPASPVSVPLEPATVSPNVPIPGTTGSPKLDRSLKRP